MTTTNPYADDPDKAEIYELGYINGFQEPYSQDFPPLSEELLGIYQAGVDNGTNDAISSPVKWVTRSEAASSLEAEPGNEPGNEQAASALNWLAKGVLFGARLMFKKAAFSLVSLLVTVVQIPGDVALQPAEDEDFDPTQYEWPYVGPEDDTAVTYVAVCPRDDHAVMEVGVTPEGYWVGSGTNDFATAMRTAVSHEHREAFITRCDLTDRTCVTVWAAHSE